MVTTLDPPPSAMTDVDSTSCKTSEACTKYVGLESSCMSIGTKLRRVLSITRQHMFCRYQKVLTLRGDPIQSKLGDI
jgi:hypothetical protein